MPIIYDGDVPDFNPRRRRARRRKTVVLSSRKKVPSNKQLEKKIKQLQTDTETKWKDNYSSGSVFGNDTVYGALQNGLLKGDDFNQREGVRIRATSLKWSGNFMTQNQLTPTIIRMIIFWDTDAKGDAPTLSSTADSGVGLLDITTITDLTVAPYMRVNQGRYKILYDKKWIINPDVLNQTTTVAGVTVSNSVLQKYHPFKGKVKLSRFVHYDNSNNGNITDIQKNSLYIYAMSNFSFSSGFAPQIHIGARFNFKDS